MLQVDKSVAPLTEVTFPSGHAVQELRPLIGLYFPWGHNAQDWGVSGNDPRWQKLKHEHRSADDK